MHDTAAHFFDRAKPKFSDFAAFLEFVSGPLDAGAFGPDKPDATFGLQVVFQKAPEVQNSPPGVGFHFFGQVDIDAKTRAFTVTLKDLTGQAVYGKTLAPA